MLKVSFEAVDGCCECVKANGVFGGSGPTNIRLQDAVTKSFTAVSIGTSEVEKGKERRRWRQGGDGKYGEKEMMLGEKVHTGYLVNVGLDPYRLFGLSSIHYNGLHTN
ncbi:arabidopsis phospholipase-like protein [Striga asiatica]|uniref:Arabidopsis phospholipase-like protein n=1 Tax=Striga asiatica TaxID=4170 RepID=A0A5A7QWS6_STRAF|nr:arabidopsis phospholipase-like protein [Striga asiatica]